MGRAVAPEAFWVAIDAGVSVAVAARQVGCGPATGYRWMREAGRPLPTRGGQGVRRSPRTREQFWARLRTGETIAVAARSVGVSDQTGYAWFRQAGGMRLPTVNPQEQSQVTAGSGPLSFVDRCRIEDLLDARYKPARIAELLGRHRSTIGREIARGRGPEGTGRYRAIVAQSVVEDRRRRPKTRKLVEGTRLYDEVTQRLLKKHSPEQIAGALRRDFPEEPEMWVSHETIYQAVYVQARGGLKAEVKAALRTGRIKRKPQGRNTSKRPKFQDMVSISERPAEAADRAIPGHWEGDLIVGAHHASAIGTLVERTTGFVMLLHLPEDHTAETVAAAMTAAIPQIPAVMWRSLTWDQGSEMALHTQITGATGLPIYFADPHSPWQRPCNENINGLLRQYFPKGTDLSFHGPGILANVAAELNARPRKRHQWASPAEKLDELLNSPPSGSESGPVASTA